MLFQTPTSDEIDGLCAELDDLKSSLRSGVGEARPWTLPIRRFEAARAWASSIRIEGFEVPDRRAGQLASGAAEPDPGDENEAAFVCYAQAMEHVSVLARDPGFRWSDRVILDLHFETCRFQRNRNPGLLRNVAIEVTSDAGGTAYLAPEADRVPSLLDEFIVSLESGPDRHPAVVAAMAHLNLVSIHPFEDGNGRISRITQSLVLAREHLLAPEFGSIEPFLARHTVEYYEALMHVQGGSFDPSRDATGWVIFCLRAHIEQAADRLKRIEAAAERWRQLEELVESHGWDERMVIALEQALFGGTDRTTYTAEASIANPTASNDFRRLVDAGLLEKVGSGRATAYKPTDELNDSLKPESR